MPIAEQIPNFELLPKYLQVFLVNAIAFLLAMLMIYVLRRFLVNVLMRGVRRLAGRTSFNQDDILVDAVERPMRVAVLGVGIFLVSFIFDFTADIDAFADSLSRALLLASAIFLVYNLVDIIGFTSETVYRVTGVNIQERLLPFLRTVTKVFILVMGLFIIMQEFNYDVTGLVASFGVVGLAFSLAAQDTAANVFGFTAIVSDNPFKVGDYIVTNDFAGTVEHVGVRSTRVRKLDQSLVSVPNSSLSDGAVTNWSRLAKRRLDFYIGLTYSTTSQQMRALVDAIKEMLRARDVVDTESVVVHFTDFADSSLNVRIIAYVWLSDWNEFTAEQEQINLTIMEIVEEHGLSFAFPSQSLYVESFPQMQQANNNGKSKSTPSTPQIPQAILEREPTSNTEQKYQENESASNDGSDVGEGDGR